MIIHAMFVCFKYLRRQFCVMYICISDTFDKLLDEKYSPTKPRPLIWKIDSLIIGGNRWLSNSYVIQISHIVYHVCINRYIDYMVNCLQYTMYDLYEIQQIRHISTNVTREKNKLLINRKYVKSGGFTHSTNVRIGCLFYVFTTMETSPTIGEVPVKKGKYRCP